MPPEVVDRAKGVTLHALASVLIGSQTAPGTNAIRLITEEEAGVRGGATLLVDGGRVTKGGAAFANSEMAFAGGKWDTFRMLTRGEAVAVDFPTPQRKPLKMGEHPAFRDKLSRDDRWAVIFYTRYLAGAGDIQAPSAQAPEVDAIFGGNCAVCHGKRGFADGPLHIAFVADEERAGPAVRRAVEGRDERRRRRPFADAG